MKYFSDKLVASFPGPPQALRRLQYGKIGDGRPGIIYHTSDIRVREGSGKMKFQDFTEVSKSHEKYDQSL